MNDFVIEIDYVEKPFRGSFEEVIKYAETVLNKFNETNLENFSVYWFIKHFEYLEINYQEMAKQFDETENISLVLYDQKTKVVQAGRIRIQSLNLWKQKEEKLNHDLKLLPFPIIE